MSFLYDFISYSILFITFFCIGLYYVSFNKIMAHLFDLFPYYWEQMLYYLQIMRYVMLVM